jgi:hypothetical protein
MIRKLCKKLCPQSQKNFEGMKKETEIEIFPDDIFIVSYPKSGNTWVRFLIGNYITKCGLDFTNSHLLLPDVHFNPDQCAKVELRPRFIKSHHTYRPEYPRVIYICRDGRDVAVSYFYYLKKTRILDDNAQFTTFLRDFAVKGIIRVGAWSQHVDSWTKEDRKESVLILKYEDILKDAEHELERIVKFANLELDKDLIAEAVRASTFEKMQKLEIKQHADYFARYGGENEKIRFIRKGHKGDWRNHFSKEDEEFFKYIHGTILNKMGYV